MSSRGLLSGYSTREVSSLLGLRPSRIRSWVRDGLLAPRRGPRGEYRFSFQDLVLLRAAAALLEQEVPSRKVLRALRRLRQQLPRGRSLAAVRITAEGSEIAVRDGAELWEPASGQKILDFEVAELARKVAPLAHRRAEAARGSGEALAAEEWYELACELEAAAPEEAKEAYRRALAIQPHHADAHLNLGRLLHEEGELPGAEEHYRKALEARPGDATAAFNLGVALEDLDRPRQAMAAYQEAIAADPESADAYYNLAGLCERLGRRAAALRHLKTYRRLTRGS